LFVFCHPERLSLVQEEISQDFDLIRDPLSLDLTFKVYFVEERGVNSDSVNCKFNEFFERLEFKW
jgi:hypothetical protein